MIQPHQLERQPSQPPAGRNNNVTIHFTATDDCSGVSSIKIPHGNTVNSSSADYTVSTNDTYNFIVTDGVGNTATVPVTVSNIDKTPPSGNSTLSKTGWTCGNETISFTGTDDLSGVDNITLPDGSTVTGSTASYTVTDNGTFAFTVKDKAGNTATVPVIVSNIDKTVSVTHPLKVSYTIDPNTGKMTADAIPLTNNNAHTDLIVKVQSVSSSGISDVDPGSVPDWNALSASQTASKMAFAIQPAGGWKETDVTSPIYASGISSPEKLGVIGTGATGAISLSAKYGLAWNNKTTIGQIMTLSFTPCDVN